VQSDARANSHFILIEIDMNCVASLLRKKLPDRLAVAVKSVRSGSFHPRRGEGCCAKLSFVSKEGGVQQPVEQIGACIKWQVAA
jgi:hypothetical protein